VARAQSQYLRIYDIDTDVTLQRWQSYYANATVTFSSQQWAYVPFTAEGFTEGISGDESNITISAPATPIVVEAFETAPQSGQQEIAVFVGQVTGGSGSLTTLTVQLGSAISPVGAQIPPRTFTTAMIGKGCKL
jgi:hypothetical protein